MNNVAALPYVAQPAEDPVGLLIADDDSALRSLVASSARLAAEAIVVHEAADGAEAIQVALQRRPQIALLDVDMPRLGGVEAALVLRELLPGLRLALHSADPSAHCASAREFCLPLFDKLEAEAALQWLVKRESRPRSLRAVAPASYRTLALECAACGYGIAGSLPPERCPMCQGKGTWVHPARAAFRRRAGVT
jgi:CheY-like chemotaxis protein